MNTTCATCVTSANNCIETCNTNCKTCIVDKTCDSCNDGRYLKSGVCELCDNSVCGTCVTSSDNCI